MYSERIRMLLQYLQSSICFKQSNDITPVSTHSNITANHKDKTQKSLLNYLIILPILSATFFSLLYLDNKSLWLDEVYSVSFINLNWSQLWKFIFIQDANMSLYYILFKIWVNMFGDSEFAVRLLSSIFAIGGVILTYKIGVRLFNVRTGLIAAMVLSVNAYFIQYAQEARGYTLTLLLCSYSVYLFIRIIETQKCMYFVIHAIINALVLYAHFFGVFVLLAQLISLVLLPSGTIQSKRILRSILLTEFLAGPIIIFILSHTSKLGWLTSKPSINSVNSLFFDFTGNGGNLLFFSYMIPCLIAFVLFLLRLYRLKRNQLVWKYGLLLFWLFVPILCIYLLSLIKPAFINRFMFPSLPAFILLAGDGLSSLRSRIISLIITPLIIVLSLHTLFYRYYPQEKSDWRSAVSFVVENQKAGDAILFYSQLVEIPFEYYYKKMNHENDILVSLYPFPLYTSSLEQKLFPVSSFNYNTLESLAEKYYRLWVVLAQDDSNKNPGWNDKPIIHKIEKKYHNIENAFFRGTYDINVKLYKIR